MSCKHSLSCKHIWLAEYTVIKFQCSKCGAYKQKRLKKVIDYDNIQGKEISQNENYPQEKESQENSDTTT